MSQGHHNSRVLIVDDEPKNLQILAELLQQEGYEINVAKDGLQALDISKEVKPDLILLDIMMPGPDGFEVCRRIKSFPETEEIPIIFLSAKSETEDIVLGFEVGASDYIIKPFRSREVLARVNTQLLLRRQMSAAFEKKKMAMSMDMARGIAHEFNNKLFVVTGSVDLIEYRFDRDEWIKEITSSITEATDKMADLVKRLIVYTSYMPWSPQNIPFNDFIRHTIILITHTMEKKIALHLDLSPEVQHAYLDLENMELAVSEIVHNAIEAMADDGAVDIKTEVVGKSECLPSPDPDTIIESSEFNIQHKSFIRLTIEDHGEGMDRDTLEKIWAPFFSTKFIGRGMGMSVVLGIVRKHKGMIQVTSKPGEGAAVHLIFPMTCHEVAN